MGGAVHGVVGWGVGSEARERWVCTRMRVHERVVFSERREDTQ